MNLPGSGGRGRGSSLVSGMEGKSGKREKYELQFTQLEEEMLLDLLTWSTVRNKHENVHEKSK